MSGTESKGVGERVSGFIAGVKGEFGKIIWPTREDIVKQTAAVVVVSVICGALIAVMDFAFEAGLHFLTKL